MMEHFISNRKIAYELADFDEKTVNLYMVCTARSDRLRIIRFLS